MMPKIFTLPNVSADKKTPKIIGMITDILEATEATERPFRCDVIVVT